jgi:hypothetical protein
MIDKKITIEELVNDYPFSVKYLMDKGIRCLRCGEPIWGTLESASLEKGFNEPEIDVFVKEINELITKAIEK